MREVTALEEKAADGLKERRRRVGGRGVDRRTKSVSHKLTL